ncbi:MAG: serine hydrolase [Patescibacteria group bacterium]
MTSQTEKFLILGVVMLMVVFGMRVDNASSVKSDVVVKANEMPPYVLDPSDVLASLSGAVVVSEKSALSTSPLLKSEERHSLPFKRFKNTEAPELQLQSALVADLESGEVFYELKPDSRWPMASLTKLMTAVISLSGLRLDEVVALDRSDFRSLPNSFTKSIEPGQMFSIRDLISLLLVSSSNEAAEALARKFGRDGFMDAMNERAREWGLQNTYFEDPAGISSANQSTATDLKALTRHINAKYPEIFRTTKSKSVSILERGSGVWYVFSNTNEFAGETGFLGGKTGYRPDSSGNLISLLQKRSRPILIIVLGTEDRFGATKALWNWFINDFTSGN